MLEAARRLKRSIASLCQLVLGLWRQHKQPFSVEDRVDKPVSLYAATKRACELIGHSYSHLYGLPATGLRFFTVYGPWGRPDMAAYLFTRAIMAGEPIDVFNDGQMARDFTYIDDIVAGTIAALDRPPARSMAPATGSTISAITTPRADRFHRRDRAGARAHRDKNLLPMQPGDVPKPRPISRRRAAISASSRRPRSSRHPPFRRMVQGYHGSAEQSDRLGLASGQTARWNADLRSLAWAMSALPVALALAKKFEPVFGFDISQRRIAGLRDGEDVTGEVTAAELRASEPALSPTIPTISRGQLLHRHRADADRRRTPARSDAAVSGLRADRAACCAPAPSSSSNSTVYPGLTREICGPLLAKHSGLRQGVDFKLGYSPERINPGRPQHRLETITKIVAGEDEETLERVAAVYGNDHQRRHPSRAPRSRSPRPPKSSRTPSAISTSR